MEPEVKKPNADIVPNTLGEKVSQEPAKTPELLPPDLNDPAVKTALKNATTKIFYGSETPNTPKQEIDKDEQAINEILNSNWKENLESAKQRVASEPENKAELDATQRRQLAKDDILLRIRDPKAYIALPVSRHIAVRHFAQENNQEFKQFMSEYGGEQPSWAAQLGGGVWSLVKAQKLETWMKLAGKGGFKGKTGAAVNSLSIGQLMGAWDSITATDKWIGEYEGNYTTYANNFLTLVKEVQDKPELINDEKVKKLYDFWANHRDLNKYELKQQFPEMSAIAESLNKWESAEFQFQRYHEHPTVRSNKTGTAAPRLSLKNFGVADISRLTEMTADQMREKDLADNPPKPQDLIEGKTRTIYTQEKVSQENRLKRILTDTYTKLGINPKGEVKDAVDPVEFFRKNLGNGALADLEDFNKGVSMRLIGTAYGLTPVARYEAAVSGFHSLGLTLGGKSSSEIPPIRDLFSTESDEQWAINHIAGVQNDIDIDALNKGENPKLVSWITSQVTGKTLEESQELANKWHFSNSEMGNVGLMAAMPSGLVGKAGTLTRASIIAGEGALGATYASARYLAKKGVISMGLARGVTRGAFVAGSAVHTLEAYTFGLPVKVVGYTLGTSGRIAVATYGVVGQRIANLASKSAKAMGADVSPQVFKHTLMGLGVTDAFFGMGMGGKAMAILGFGKSAEAFGTILSKAGYKGANINGYGFTGALEQLAVDSEVGYIAQNLAKFGARFSPLTTVGHDVIKGAWHGAGVGYGLGYMHSGHESGVHGIWGGIGMGGFGGAMGSVTSMRLGFYSHSGAVNWIRETAKNDPRNTAIINEIIERAEQDQDWSRIPLLAGAFKQAGQNNMKIVMHGEQDIDHINADNIRLDNVHDTDYKIGGKQFRVKELQIEVERLKQESRQHNDKGDIAKAHETAKLAGEKNAELNKEINEWLTEVRLKGTEEQRTRINTRQNQYKGVYLESTVGNGVIYINTDRTGLTGNMASGVATNTTAAHEVAHGIQSMVLRHQAVSHFRSSIFGVGFEDGSLVLQKGALDKELLAEFAGIYNETLFGGNQAAGDVAKQKIFDAYSVLENSASTKEQTAAAKEILTRFTEEFGVNYFEAFLQRNRPDYLFKGGKYPAMQRLLNKAENYLDFKIKQDLNGQGIILRIQEVRDARSSQEVRALKDKQNTIVSQMNAIHDQMVKLVKSRNLDGSPVVERKDQKEYLTLKDKLDRLRIDKSNVEKSLNVTEIGSIFRTKDGTHLVIPQAEKAMVDLVRRMESKNDRSGKFSSPLDLSTIKDKAELHRILSQAGLEHWVDQDGNLKSQTQINKEAAERGEKIIKFLEEQPSAVTGIVITTDEKGNKRGTGVLTDEALVALRDAGHLLPSEVVKLTTFRDIINYVNGRSPMGGGEVDIVYNALSVERTESDGSTTRLNKPKNQIDQTHRSIVPYKMEFVMVSKDANGNKIEPRFELMVTAIDMGNVLERAANEFSKTYTLPSGKVISVSDLFSGDFAVFKHHLARYMQNLSEGGIPSEQLFGGGEIGKATRDIIHRTLGGIPKGGHGPNGESLLYNNPIIRPWHPWERGPLFPFTTFRMDLVQDISVTAGNFRFNEEVAYPRHVGNYSPVNFSDSQITDKSGRSTRVVRGEHEYDVINKKTGIATTVKSKYTITQKDGKFYVGGSDFKDNKYSFSTIEQAKDFIGLDSQRRQLIGSNLLPSHLMGGDNGILVANIDGNYLLVDTQRDNKLVEGRSFRNESEAITYAAKLHNDNMLAKIRSKKDPSTRLFEEQIAELARINESAPDLLPLRIALDKNGNPKVEVVTDTEGKPRKYTAKDTAVMRGLAKVGDKVKKLSFQKVGYGLMETMLGSDKYRINDTAVQAATSHIAEIIANEALEAWKNPDKRKGVTWYKDMVNSGYSILGSMYGMFTEGLGATSARTPVFTNFIQADEAMSMFSRGKYAEQLARIHQAFLEIENQMSIKNPDGTSQFESKAIDLLIRKESAKEALESSGFKNEFEVEDVINWKNGDKDVQIPKELVEKYEQLVAENSVGKKNKLTPAQLSDALDTVKKMVFKQKENLMLRENGKKYNANTIKVGQVMYNVWHELTEGPKTPNFAENLAGIGHQATIDVWAARTLHRIINSKIKGRNKWRLTAGQEMGVDYVWHNHGSDQMTQWEGGGDFFFGQDAFRKAAEILRSKGEQFADINPDDLQALMWFHEKDVWAKADATNSIGAEMSSYDGPMSALGGGRDSEGIDHWNNVRRLMAGVSGSYSDNFNIKVSGEPISVSGRGRQFAFPKERLDSIKGFVADALGKALRGANIGQTYGSYGGYTEHSLAFDIVSYRGNRTTTLLAHQESLGKLKSIQDKLDAVNAEIKNELDATKKGKLEKKQKSLIKELTDQKKLSDASGAKYESEQKSPTVTNQLGLMADFMVQQAKNYSQSDVYVAEVVGPNHPNARPAGDVLFGRSLTADEALQIAQSLRDKTESISNFTLTPDPRNPNAERISQLTKKLEGLEKNSDEWSKTNSEIQKLGRFIGLQTSCIPEFTARYSEYSSIKEVKDGTLDLLTVNGAKSYMDIWAKDFNKLQQNNESTNGIELKFQQYHISAEAIPKGGYDTFNSANIGPSETLGSRLDRYRVGLERENALRSENEQSGDLFTEQSTVLADNRTVWNPTESQSSKRSKFNDALVSNEQGQDATSTQKNLVVSAEEAAKWVAEKFAAPIRKSEGGIMWGDKNYTVTQKRLADGSFSNQFEVMGAFDRRPSLVTGKDAAMALVKSRLEGTAGAQSGERSLMINGERFKVNEATSPVFADGESAKESLGMYPTDSNMFKYSPDDRPTVEIHPWQSKSIEEAFPSSPLLETIKDPYSHRAQKYLARVNSVLDKINPDLKISLRMESETKDRGSNIGAGKRIYTIFSLYISSKNSGIQSPTKVGYQAMDISLPEFDPITGVSYERDRKGFSPKDAGWIGSASVLNGEVFHVNEGLEVLKNYPELRSRISEVNEGVYSNKVFEVIMDFINEHTSYNDPNGQRNSFYELQDFLRSYSNSEFKKDIKKIVNVFNGVFATHKIGGNKITLDQLSSIAYELQGAGSALNAEHGARLKAAGLMPKGTLGIKSSIVNTTGAVIKARNKTYGEGNTTYDFGGIETTDPTEAIALNTGKEQLHPMDPVGRKNGLDSTTFVDPTRRFSPDDPTREIHPAGSMSIDEAFPRSKDYVEAPTMSHRGMQFAERVNNSLSNLTGSTNVKLVLKSKVEPFTIEGSSGNIDQRWRSTVHLDWVLYNENNKHYYSLGGQSVLYSFDKTNSRKDSGDVMGSAFLNGSAGIVRKTVEDWSNRYPKLIDALNAIPAQETRIEFERLAREVFRKNTTTADKPNSLTTRRYDALREQFNEMVLRPNNILSALHYMEIPISFKNIVEFSNIIRGAGASINAEHGARLKAAGRMAPDSEGVKSFIKDETGAIMKIRNKVFGDMMSEYNIDTGNPEAYDSSNHTYGLKDALRLNKEKNYWSNRDEGTGGEINIVHWVNPKQKFSPSEKKFVKLDGSADVEKALKTETKYQSLGKYLGRKEDEPK